MADSQSYAGHWDTVCTCSHKTGIPPPPLRAPRNNIKLQTSSWIYTLCPLAVPGVSAPPTLYALPWKPRIAYPAVKLLQGDSLRLK